MRSPLSVNDREILSVVGEGKVELAPDLAVVTLGAEARGDTAEDAMKEVSKRATALRKVLTDAKIADQDIMTDNFQISFVREPVTRPVTPAAPAPKKSGEKPEIMPVPTEEVWVERYLASTNFQVRVRDLSKVGAVITAAVGAGANQGWGLNFSISEPKAALTEARTKAIADAKVRAQDMASALGIELGPVLRVTEAGGGGGDQPMYAFRAAKMASGSNMEAMDLPVAPGKVKYEQRVELVFSIAPKPHHDAD